MARFRLIILLSTVELFGSLDKPEVHVHRRIVCVPSKPPRYLRFAAIFLSTRRRLQSSQNISKEAIRRCKHVSVTGKRPCCYRRRKSRCYSMA